MTQSFPITDEIVEKLKKEAVKADRAKLFGSTIGQFQTLYAALTALPYKDAQAAIAELNELQGIIVDPLGEHVGACGRCEEPVFVTGQPDDDVEHTEDGDVWHRTCADEWRKEHPDRGDPHVIDDGDGFDD
jgi:hypothetical protein